MKGDADMQDAPRASMMGGALDELFAWHQGVPVSRGQFIARVEALAGELPDARYAINLCEDRYRFTVGFCATLLRGQINLLPPNRTAHVIQEIAGLHDDLYTMGEGSRAFASGRWIDVSSVSRAPTASAHTIPWLRAAATAAITFTSGSTGRPQPHPKQWGSLVVGAQNLARHVHGIGGAFSGIVATVPPQHMYGLEASVLLALHGCIALHGGRPLFPRDVRGALATSGASPLLVTTPVHLRALVRAGTPMPRCALVLSATAPLDVALARDAESLLGCAVREIYGSTETGVVAGRRTVDGPLWTPFEGVRVDVGKDGNARVQTGHLDTPVGLGDFVRVHAGGRFELLGRDGDLLDIAGKRASLGDLNQRLLAVPGVIDGVFLVPRDAAPDGRAPRLEALVVAPGLDKAALLDALREGIDPAFLPRRVIFLERLPRDPTGKLQRAALMAARDTGDLSD